MTIEERKMTRPDSRWKAELIGLYRSAESQWRESLDAGDRDYQSGIMMACAAIWHRVTGETLTIEQR
jgi:hypothetical protein